jgi:ABC-type uncharacterized transport system YnjBCD permease subunit
LLQPFARSSRNATFWRILAKRFDFSLLFADNGFRLALRELHSLSFERYITATTAVTLPVFEFSIAISLALILSESKLVTLSDRFLKTCNYGP